MSHTVRRPSSVDSVETTSTADHAFRLNSLLHELYDGLTGLPSHFGFDTESTEEASGSIASDVPFRKYSVPSAVADVFLPQGKYTRGDLFQLDVPELQSLASSLAAESAIQNAHLVKHLKRRDRELYRRQGRCNIITAILQAMSPKRSVDTKLQFTLEPPRTDSGYVQWLDAMRAVAKLPDGIPLHFRKKLWLTLADQYIVKHGINWSATCSMAFSDRITAEDENLGMQIIKDLHRTGWSGLCGERERVMLKRVLLAYARYNPRNGYCQGFNVIAALILEVVEYKEEQALKVMMMLVETVLPEGYFDQTLRALSVDMAVLRELMHQRLPKLSAHLDHLQKVSESEYEPPLTNVFSMQWFLTLFATCLPRSGVFRIWDALVLEGSEILLRTALAIWARIARRVFRAKSADEFYSLMGPISQELLMMTDAQCNDLLQVIYNLNEFPYPGLAEIRERYTWNIQPLSSNFRLVRTQVSQILSNETTVSDEQASCITGFLLSSGDGKLCGASTAAVTKSKHVTDLNVLRKQYLSLTERQKQAAVILQNAYARGQKHAATQFQRADNMASPVFNHLYAGQMSHESSCLKIPMLNGTIPLSSKTVQPGARSQQSRRRPSRQDSSDQQSVATTRRQLSKTLSIDTADGDQVFEDDTIPSLAGSLDSLCEISSFSLPGSTRPRRAQSLGSLNIANASANGCKLLPRSLSCLELLLNCGAPSPRPTPRPPSRSEAADSKKRKDRHPPPQAMAKGSTPTSPMSPESHHQSGGRSTTHVTNKTFDLSIMPSSVKQYPTRYTNNTSTPTYGQQRGGSSASNAQQRLGSASNNNTTQQNPYLMGYSMPPRPHNNGGGHHSEMLQRSKQMLAALPDPGTRMSMLPPNPFPTKHRTALIEREKRMGLLKTK